jgi:parallel beta-helix repeat protein
VQNVSGPTADGISLFAGNCVIEDNEINTIFSGDGIKLYDSGVSSAGSPWAASTLPDLSPGNNEIVGNQISDIANGVGINLTDADNNEVIGNTIEDVARDGILLFAAPDFELTPVAMTDGAAGDHDLPNNTEAGNNTIAYNTIRRAAKSAADVGPAEPFPSQHYAAIHLEGNADNNEIDGNTIENAGSANYAVGIDVLMGGTEMPDDNDITHNTVSGFETVAAGAVVSEGIRILNGRNNTVLNNEVRNSGKLQYGIDVRANGVEVEDNVVEGMQEAGLFLWGGTTSNQVMLKGNEIIDCVTGVWLREGSAEFMDCNLITGGAVGVYVDTLAIATRFTFSGQNCVSCCILVRNDGGGCLDATDNYWSSDPVPGSNVFGCVDTSDALDDCPCADWDGGDGGIGSSCCTYQAGWSLMSMPVVPTDPAVPQVLTQYPFLHYDPAAGMHVQPTQVSCNEGYWLYVPPTEAPLQVCIQGTSPSTKEDIVLAHHGWHQIGTGIEGAYWANTTVTYNGVTKSLADAANDGWIVPGAQEYDSQVGIYAIANILHVCKGYWVYTYNDNITLTIPFSQPTPPSSSSLVPMVLAEGLTPPPPPALPSAGELFGLEFTNEPNPVTDVHTTTFTVKGAMATLVGAIRVEIYDLSGRLLYEEEVPSTSLDWHTNNQNGEYLANGTYLYKIYALVSNKWVVSQTKTLVVLR